MTRASRREVRDLRRQVREWRHGRADTTVLEALSDAYIALLATCMLSAMAVSAVLETRVAISASCTTTACADARYSASWVGLAAVLALTLTSARAVGPVQVTPAEGSWLLAAPVDRSAILRSRLGRVVAVSTVGSGLVGAVGSVLAGFDWSVVALIGVGSGAAGTAVGMYAVLVQVRGSGAARAARVLTWVLAAAAWTGLLLVALGAAPSPRTGDAWVAPARLAAAVAVVLAALALVVRATTVLPRLGRGRLVPGGALLASVSGAFASLDLALLYDVLVARQWLARSTVRPIRSGPKGAWALAWRDVIRLRRSPTAIVALAAAAVVPYVVVAVDLGAVVVVAGSLTLFAVGLPLCSALRTTSNSPALVRCFPMSPVAVRAACLAVPATVFVLWSAVTWPAVDAGMPVSAAGSGLMSLAVGVAGLAAVTRWLLAPPPDYSRWVVSSPAGAVPGGLAVSAFRGFDVLLLLVTPLLIGPGTAGAAVSLTLAAVVLVVLVRRD